MVVLKRVVVVIMSLGHFRVVFASLLLVNQLH